MTELEKARQTINSVDKKMAELFCERMVAAKTVAELHSQEDSFWKNIILKFA